MFRFLTFWAFAAIFSLATAVPVSAQIGLPISGTADAAPEQIIPEEMTAEAINALVARMSDDQVRAMLLDRLDAVAAAPVQMPSTRTLPEKATAMWTAFTFPIVQSIRKLPDLWHFETVAFSNLLKKTDGWGGLTTMLGLTALALLIGLAAEFAVRAYFGRIKQLDSGADSQSLIDTLRFLFRRFLREILGLIVFYFVVRTVGRAILTPEQIGLVGPLMAYLIWMPRLTAAAARFLLAPNREDLRLVSINNHWAQFLQRHIVGLVFLGGFTMFAVRFNVQLGVLPGDTGLGYMLDSLVYLYIIFIALSASEGLRDMMRGSDPDTTEFDERVASSYPYFAVVVAACTWVLVSTLIGLGEVSALLQGAHYVTMFLLLITPVIDTAVRGLVRHLLPPMQGEGPTAEAAYISTKRSLVGIGRVISIGIIMVLIARAWGASLKALLTESDGLADNMFSFLMTIVVGYVVFQGVSLWINIRLAAEQTALGLTQEDADAEMGGASGSRLSTVLPLALLSAKSTIVVIFGLLAIGNLGIDITPLLAGAGIAGLAIGFGAQKLVTDVVSGVFFLIDDAFRVGEYVEMDGTMGAVEKISIRSMQLRHHRGPVHTIPYGEIPRITNYSRDWVIMKLKFTVPFDTDPNKIKKIFKKIGQEMLADPMFKEDFLQPFKSQGVFEIDDVGMVIRGKFMAKPGKQFMIRKEIYNRVKSEFEANGIDFARREVRVAIPGMEHHENMTDEEKAEVAAAGAAAVVAQQQQDEQAPPKSDM